MKKIILSILVISFCFTYCESNVVDSEEGRLVKADDSNIIDSVKNLYKVDAYRLALREMKRSDDNYLEQIEISEEYYKYYYNSLIHIYNAVNISEADSVAHLFPIHSFPNPYFYQIIVKVEKNSEIFKKIINNEPTGIIEFDSLLSKYNFISNSSFEFSTANYFGLRTEEIINLDAFCKKLENFPSILGASPDVAGGSGNDIVGEILEDKVYYAFELGWGDCYSGCTSLRRWDFNVYLNGKVEFIESSGQTIKDKY
ncbi:MAG: hypothetical protein H6609_17990 [Ignavibacteriales bacterium]|nr:hypothetical protein [Ignavibacteriales bacterium]